MKLTYLTPREALEKLRESEIKIADTEPDEDLVESIRNVGVKTPIIVDRNFTVIDGVRRLRAVKLAGPDNVPGRVPVLVLEDIDYSRSPEEALLQAFLINRYRRGSEDRHFDIDTVADLLTKYAFTIAKPIEKQDLRRGVIPNELCQRLAKLTGYSWKHIHKLLQRGLARWKLTHKFPTLEVTQVCTSSSTVGHSILKTPQDVVKSSDESSEKVTNAHYRTTPDVACTMTSATFSSSSQFRSTQQKNVTEVAESAGPSPKVSDDVFVQRVIDCARKLHLMSKLILGVLPQRVAECVVEELGYSVQHVYDRFTKLKDVIVREANRVYALNIKISQEKARIILELPDSFIKWVEEQAPLFLKRFFEYLDPEDIKEVYKLWSQGREYEALSLAMEKIKQEHKERYEHRRYAYKVEVPGFLLEVVNKIALLADSTVDTVFWQCFKLCYVVLKLVIERNIDARMILQLIEDLYLSSQTQVDVVKLHNFLKVLVQ